ncbi:peptide-methionine (R)-S-oxide reductase [Rhodovulum sp. ES.010]|uniref:peptide-methionine (R)-S-oxide reductase MsrB n=1 Tax=Rhodovulum sp. ES.010 TaxID=1882821 RepID=UPI00092977E2|nr:peptide-methionine (R)-S-oxide reductase MsrB [Rhodovulum sp. ES.010]SIO22647.1 peptide-methionine (R)-S-oxide reductase [Rhodovulum sp. ES.010]
MIRRQFLSGAAALALAAPAVRAAESFEITRTEAEWKAMLTDLEYEVMRKEGTERAFTSPLNDEKRAGTFLCKGCALPLYSSETKFDSGTGWPSFYRALSEAVATKPDRKLIWVRTEVHCRRCGSHLGHIFDDGPPPTGKRHCINGVSLTFRPAQGA